jgi:hypothetical protein
MKQLRLLTAWYCLWIWDLYGTVMEMLVICAEADRSSFKDLWAWTLQGWALTSSQGTNLGIELKPKGCRVAPGTARNWLIPLHRLNSNGLTIACVIDDLAASLASRRIK